MMYNIYIFSTPPADLQSQDSLRKGMEKEEETGNFVFSAQIFSFE